MLNKGIYPLFLLMLGCLYKKGISIKSRIKDGWMVWKIKQKIY